MSNAKLPFPQLCRVHWGEKINDRPKSGLQGRQPQFWRGEKDFQRGVLAIFVAPFQTELDSNNEETVVKLNYTEIHSNGRTTQNGLNRHQHLVVKGQINVAALVSLFVLSGGFYFIHFT